jgi:hypothetical protein
MSAVSVVARTCAVCPTSIDHLRPGTRFCGTACKQLAYRRRKTGRPSRRAFAFPQHEPLIIELVSEKRLDPWDALYWTVAPEFMRDVFRERQAREDERLGRQWAA